MPETPSAAAPLPKIVRWFAPWTWRPWTRWVMVGLLLVGYVLAETPLAYLLVRSGEPELLVIAHLTFFAPVRADVTWQWLPLGPIHDAELTVLEHLFGPDDQLFFPPPSLEDTYPMQDGVIVIPSNGHDGTSQEMRFGRY